ncbi:hypothetical protein [Pseudomonas chlororaphis]|uniref:hypothetical protein n=1 Tax=Pseudomonas chlororaphis TaxID=587753 RepID=UPI00068B6446|nr:hypothetical protein [Pseudomonas chlororaphis]
MAAPELTVKFHMGVGNGTSQAVGGTLTNSGDAPIAQGYLIVTPVNAQCRPGASVMYAIGAIQPGEEQSFNVPMKDPFSNYRLQMGGFDEQGFIVPAQDANQVILDGRLKEQREKCGSLNK